MQPLLSFKSVSKGYDDLNILDHMDLDIESGYFYTLLGPSGCGKTTILKLIAGSRHQTVERLFIKIVLSKIYRLINVRSIPFFKIMRYSRISMFMIILLLV